MRFPRIVRLRPDKPVAEIDTLDTVRAIVEGRSEGPS
jgi:ATP-dependent DNA ligase